MGGLGTMSEPRLNLNVRHGTQDPVAPKMPAFQAYQLSLQAPAEPAGRFDVAAAARGKLVFEGADQRATSHLRPVHRRQCAAACRRRLDGRTWVSEV